jgi:hypothetical protein
MKCFICEEVIKEKEGYFQISKYLKHNIKKGLFYNDIEYEIKTIHIYCFERIAGKEFM